MSGCSTGSGIITTFISSTSFIDLISERICDVGKKVNDSQDLTEKFENGQEVLDFYKRKVIWLT